MEPRSWMSHSKSFEKSSSESMSSHSQTHDQVYATHIVPSPEVISEGASNEEVVTDVHTLTGKLSAALLDISAKEDLVKQNAKVAEEAVSGWEKAENEVLTLKQQLDAAKQQNAVLEDQVSHLNGKLKDCMRQLRQAREEQEQKTLEAVANNSCNWESKRDELEWKVTELEVQLQTAKEDAATSVNSDLLQRLQDVERENSSLKIELQSRLEELKFKTIEWDLSTQAAERESKQHLESITKVAKLEAECQRLNAVARKTFSVNDRRSLTYYSVYAESFTDSMSDNGERLLVVESDMHKFGGREINEGEPKHYDSWPSASITELDQFKNENTTAPNRICLSTQIDLMDDFLEMERLAALPDTASDQPNVGQGTDTVYAEVEALVQKNDALEKKLAKMEADKIELEMDLNECQKQLVVSQSRVKEAELEVIELQTQLTFANKSIKEEYEELKASRAKNEKVESKLRAAQTEVEELISKICSLEEEIDKERALSADKLELEVDLIECQKQLKVSQSRVKEVELEVIELQKQLVVANKSNEEEYEELKVSRAKNENAESKLRATQTEAEELISKICSLEEEIEKERALSAGNLAKCEKLEEELLRVKKETQLHQDTETLHREGVDSELMFKQEKELALAATRFSECRKTIESLGQKLMSLATLEDFIFDSEDTMELTSEVTPPGPQDGGEQLKLHNSDLSFPKRDSSTSLNPSNSFGKSHFSFGRFYPTRA
ncbi:putative filament-like plant protein [Medicago truncatula]|uniref:Filament-like plant protein n=1 Tax=Medicago truncatula TaxID=3880 RepID=G7J2M7_MEDTR|nr:filament-like plant protein 3 [Medicago truncatula]AES72942.1 filament-like plant protein [Medicago truncatula]RHN69999.1 putative filament-like plant protein [Medicago truncatula]